MRPVAKDRTGPRRPLLDARAHLRRADPVLARLIDQRPDFDPRGWMDQLPAMDLYGAEPWRPYRSLATSYLFTAGPEGSDEAQAAAQTGDTADQVAPREG